MLRGAVGIDRVAAVLRRMRRPKFAGDTRRCPAPFEVVVSAEVTAEQLGSVLAGLISAAHIIGSGETRRIVISTGPVEVRRVPLLENDDQDNVCADSGTAGPMSGTTSSADASRLLSASDRTPRQPACHEACGPSYAPRRFRGQPN